MKSSRRNDRRTSDGSKPSRPDPRRPATPTMDGMRPDMPSEFIDLSTESFREAFPDLARGKPENPQSRGSHPPARDPKDKGKG